MSHRPAAIALVLAALTVLLLSLGHRDVGYVRDEGIYFEASRSHGAWVAKLLRDPARALARAERDKHFRVNREHPALMKTLAGMSARLLAEPPAPGSTEDATDRGGLIAAMPEGAAMRLPAQLLAGLTVALLFLAAGATAGTLAGLLAAGWFALLPHVAFHAGLHAFDVPIAAMILAVVLAYRRGLAERRWGIAVGPLLGLAIAVKHNALFVGPLLALHYYACLAWARWREGRTITRAQLLPLPLLLATVTAPLVAFAAWPWLWGAPVDRFVEYLDFHRQHSYYNMEFLGINYNQPPLPISYPFVMTWATVPTVLLVLALVGLAVALRADLRRGDDGERAAPTWWAPLPQGWNRHDGLLFTTFAAAPLVLIAWPTTPIFGGTKHWLTAYPFLALAAARAWAAVWAAADAARVRRRLEPALLVACLAPSAWATIDGHPYNLSQYAPLAGGARGAAELGLNRGFWGYAALPLLPIASDVAPRGPIHLHDLDGRAKLQYVREGRWPQGLADGPLERARTGLVFHEMHMTSHELATWERFGTTAPVAVIALDGVPLTSLYAESAR
jgi:hypothetical protein